MDFIEVFNMGNFIVSKSPHLTKEITDEILKLDALISSNKDKKFVKKSCEHSFKLINLIFLNENYTDKQKQDIHQEKVDFWNKLKDRFRDQ